MIVKLPYGSGTCTLDLRGLRVRALRPRAPPGGCESRAVVARALDQPLDGLPLAERCWGRRAAVVVVPDATRAAGLSAILPVVFDRMRRGGLAGHGITVLVANGTHPAVGRSALEKVTGPLPEGVRLEEHDSRDPARLAPVGRLSSGVAVRLHRLAVEADLLVTVGAVRHHYFAGFGGGPKMVFPGLAGHAEIQANHRLVLEAGSPGVLRRHPDCEPGVLEGNPVAEQIAEAADLRPPDLALCAVLGSDGQVAWAGAGSWRPAFAEAVRQVRAWYEVEGVSSAGLLVASADGEPMDLTLIQAHKALDAACRFAAPGGEVLFVADLRGGAGSEDMQPFLADPRPTSILRRLGDQWVQYGHTTLRLVEKASRFRIFLHSRLPPELARRLGFLPVVDPADVIDRWRSEAPGATVTVVPGAPVYPRPLLRPD